jgi:hypothetical protein
VDPLVLVDTHANGDALRDNLAPDISVYAANNVPGVDAKTDFSKTELFVEFKFAQTSDPFRDPKDTRAKNFQFDNVSEVSQLNRGQLVHMQRLTRGLSFASTHSPYLYADDLQDSFVGIAAARLLPRASTTSKNPISFRPFSGVTHISIRTSEDTTLPSHRHRRKISSRSSMSNTVCGKIILPIVNSV